MRLGRPLPALQLSFVTDQAILSWGTWPTNFVLESTGDLSSSNVWSPVNALVETTNNQNIVILPKENQNRLFHLKQFSP
jgi:hypothetical protein